VTDALDEEARAQFTEKELVDLCLAVITINAWNGLAVTFRPGGWQLQACTHRCGSGVTSA
jgi:hypothetical protein